MKVVANEKAIRDQLKKKNLRIKQLADLTKFSYPHMHRVISGKLHTSLSTALLIAYVLDVDVNELFEKIE